MTETRPDPVERDRALRRTDEQRAVDALDRHLRWHAEAGGRGLTLDDAHRKVASDRYGINTTRRRLQELVDAGRAHKVVVDQVAIWRHGAEPLDAAPTTADRVLEAVKTWPTWPELEAAIGLKGFDLGEITGPLERERHVVRRTTFRAPGQMAWLPAGDAGKALSARELAVLVHLEALPTSTDAVTVLRGEATDPEGWTSVTATRERLGFTHSAWSYVTGNAALGAELRAKTLGGRLLERQGSTTNAQVRLSTWARALLAELRARGLLEAPETAPAAAGAVEGLSVPSPPVGETNDVAGDGLVQPSPLDPIRVNKVAAGDAHLSGREGTDEVVAGGDPAEPHSDPQDPNGVEEPELTLADWPDVDVFAEIDAMDGNSDEVSAAPDGNSHKSVGDVFFEVRTCVLCGCTDDQACEGGCTWARAFPKDDEDRLVCSACLTRVEVVREALGLADLDVLRVEVVGAVEVVRAEVVGIRNDLVEEATRAGREGAQLLAALLATDLGKLGASLAALEQRLGVVDELARRVELLAVQVDRVERHVEDLRSRPSAGEAVRRLLEVA